MDQDAQAQMTDPALDATAEADAELGDTMKGQGDSEFPTSENDL